jgi:hypothetical protein
MSARNEKGSPNGYGVCVYVCDQLVFAFLLNAFKDEIIVGTRVFAFVVFRIECATHSLAFSLLSPDAEGRTKKEAQEARSSKRISARLAPVPDTPAPDSV